MLEICMASVVVVQDAFTSFYDTQVLLDLLDLLLLLGIRPCSRGSVQTGSRCMCRISRALREGLRRHGGASVTPCDGRG